MGKIEEQIEQRNREFVADLLWYIHSMNTLQVDYFRSVNDLNTAYNEKLAEHKKVPEVKPRKRTKKSDKN